MPSNQTTLAELVEALEAEAASARQRATTYRTFGTSNSASDYEALKADLMERAAKVLRAAMDAPCEHSRDGYGKLSCDRLPADHDGLRHTYQRPRWLADAITRALGGPA